MVAGSIPARSGNVCCEKIDLEIFSVVILSRLQIQEGQLSVSDKRMCISTGSRLRGLSLPRRKCG